MPKQKRMEIRELGDPVLRLKAKKIEKSELKKPAFKKFLKDMFVSLKKEDGVGLAAPQIGRSIRVFVIGMPDENGRMAKEVVINPKITKRSKATVPSWEGCLSIPGFRGLVKRNKNISVSYMNERGMTVKRNMGFFEAIVFQHEYDHLEGIVYLDRLVSMKNLLTTKEFERRLQ